MERQHNKSILWEFQSSRTSPTYNRQIYTDDRSSICANDIHLTHMKRKTTSTTLGCDRLSRILNLVISGRHLWANDETTRNCGDFRSCCSSTIQNALPQPVTFLHLRSQSLGTRHCSHESSASTHRLIHARSLILRLIFVFNFS